MAGFFDRKPTQADPNRGQFYKATVALPMEHFATDHYAPALAMGRAECLALNDAVTATAKANRNGSVSLEIPVTGSGRYKPHG